MSWAPGNAWVSASTLDRGPSGASSSAWTSPTSASSSALGAGASAGPPAAAAGGAAGVRVDHEREGQRPAEVRAERRLDLGSLLLALAPHDLAADGERRGIAVDGREPTVGEATPDHRLEAAVDLRPGGDELVERDGRACVGRGGWRRRGRGFGCRRRRRRRRVGRRGRLVGRPGRRGWCGRGARRRARSGRRPRRAEAARPARRHAPRWACSGGPGARRPRWAAPSAGRGRRLAGGRASSGGARRGRRGRGAGAVPPARRRAGPHLRRARAPGGRCAPRARRASCRSPAG